MTPEDRATLLRLIAEIEAAKYEIGSKLPVQRDRPS
jgi:hypothetical protein